MVRRCATAFLAALMLAGCSSGSSRPAATPSVTISTTAPAPSHPAPSHSATSRRPRLSPAPSAIRATGPCGFVSRAPARYTHVVWIWMENHSYDTVIGRGSAAYINRLAASCGLATDYHSITHPSLPNYLAAVSGTTGGVSSDCSPSSCPQSAPTIFGQLGTAGLSWRSYDESMPSNCYGSSSGDYAPKHNPAVYYPAIRAACQRYDVPLTDFSSASLPSFTFVTPNLCHDMHDCSIGTGDRWLAGFVPRILNSSPYRAGTTAVFITWDEGSGGSHIATLVISPSTPVGLRSAAAFDHYSLLRTTEELLGLSLLGHASSAASMRTAFHL